jgi:hypothetical protein
LDSPPKGWTEPFSNSRRFGDPNGLTDYLAQFVASEEGDIGRIATASDTDDAFNRRQSGRIDEPPRASIGTNWNPKH